MSADPADDLTADAIRARTGDGCQRCGITPDRPCYLPARRCPRVEQPAELEAIDQDDDIEEDA